ncbi:MAG: glutamate--tRNA ligase [Clostridia bacterium]|nr:glutamate--tRNA ligase [Clostridia bacterium]
MTDFEKLAELLLPNTLKTPDYYENLYQSRNLPEGAAVTRIAPSPTGYLHLGTLFMALVNRITADSTDGTMFIRIEDTDKKREIEGGIEDIVNGLEHFGVHIDEGFTVEGQKGEYGPYQQSHRAEIYQCYVKKLIEQGLAYPCFCTAEELEEVRAQQEKDKIRTGYHGKWAKHRDITYEEAKALVEEGKPYVIRLKSQGSEDKKIVFTDGIKGKIEMPENDEDFVLLKSDGIPTYHFAHAVDDHLMKTTHVIRGDEWISSTPKHLELFKLLGFKAPKYAHVAPIMKLDNGNKRKISKRKDPEAAVRYFIEQGFPAESVIEYLMTIASSEFEAWRKANKLESYKKFKFNLKKMSLSGALFDGAKLLDVSKNVICLKNSDIVVKELITWAEEFDKEFADLLKRDMEFTKKIFAIDRDVPKPRKDIARYSEAKEYAAYFFNELFVPNFELPENISKEDAVSLLKAYKSVYDEKDEQSEWFEKIKSICPDLGFAPDTKTYKANPEAYKGNPGDVSTLIRIAVTGRTNTPDLCSIMKTIGKDESLKRIDNAIATFEA